MKTLTLGLAGLVLLAATHASATTRTFTAYMTQSQEPDPTGSTASGGCKVVIDDVTRAVTFNGSFTGLQGPATEVHVHQETGGTILINGTPGLTMLPRGQFNYETVDLGPILAQLLAGTAYCNLHSQAFIDGEIRGQFALVQGAPAMPTWGFWMLGVGLLGVGVAQHRRRRGRSAPVRIGLA
jgi:hypothetical protein